MRVFLTGLVFGFLFLGVHAASHAEGKGRLLVVPSTESDLSPELRGRLHEVITRVASTYGEGVIRDPEAGACGSSECVLEAGRNAGATHVVWVAATFRNESYSLNLEVWDVEAGRELGSDARECPICATQDLLDAASSRGRVLLERIMRNATRVEPAEKPAKATASSAVSPTPTPGWSRPRFYTGLGLALAGLGVGLTGVYYIAQDGKAVDGNPFVVRDTMDSGVALGVAGATAFVCGAALLTWHWLDSTTVAVGPGTLRIAGRF